ncbi:MAG TPA: hypothetical protein VN638_12300, partial [Nitrospiraceae bacterium]|nr:hypothetical protein [Nitrospiraceae bacterium]
MRTEGQLTRSATEPRLQLSDIQGNILSGFNKDHQRFLFFAIRDPRATKAWLERLGGQIATGSEVFNFNRLYKQMRKRRGTLQTVLETVWVSIAFSFQGLTQLTADVGFDDQAFRMGAHSRSVLLGDPSDPKAKGNFANWKVGS